MAFVRYVRPSKEKERICLGVDTGEQLLNLSVRRDTYLTIGEPHVGCKIDGESLESVISDNEQYKCMKKALSLLAYADNNRRALYMKLCRAGFSWLCKRSF